MTIIVHSKEELARHNASLRRHDLEEILMLWALLGDRQMLELLPQIVEDNRRALEPVHLETSGP